MKTSERNTTTTTTTIATNNNEQRVKIKESEKRDKYWDLVRDMRKLWNMRVTVIPIEIGALEMVPKGLERGLEELEIEGRIETMQSTALLKSAWILRRVLETWGDLLSISLLGNVTSQCFCEELTKREIIITMPINGIYNNFFGKIKPINITLRYKEIIHFCSEDET